ncbi:MAG: redoxin family protein [Chitinophagaceae bacterium]|jgi:thiol-disulfide isomerase/thioredoxin|nr:redoxin family protein [Chitinophagaceae bacterium]MBP6045512.1 redoxin family protein [Ferruginibacter sp.]MBK7089039.1 redoxin family protein [Chitinophagaceae bacterium]MBK7347796.1 redoxin family protein [Chitinophagaceae bacterium]MBK7734435.1 redoxin family protein [Chitinophagaceae bacterium]
MKKKLLYGLAFLILVIIFLSRFGFQIGNLRIGHQKDFSYNQKSSLEGSLFYKNYYAQNKLLCINIWATWCVPCIEEMPSLNALKLQFSNKPIEFLSLSIDDDSAQLIKFLQTQKFAFKDITLENSQYRNAILNTLEGKKSDAYIAIKSVPNTYLLKNGVIIKFFPGQVDTAELRKVISENL